jgi:hypothetical protein
MRLLLPIVNKINGLPLVAFGKAKKQPDHDF